MGLKRTVLTLLTLSLSTVVSANLCPDIIGCYCFPSGDEYRAECSGSDIEQIPAGLPYNITQLMIRDSPIKVLLAGNLSYYSEILELEMVNNPDFESVQPGALMGMNQLQSLIFRSNALSSLPSDIFSDTPDIVSIDISDNRLDNLPEFPLPSLESLTVDKNQITTVPINAFSQCLDLMLLDLSHNDINNVGSNAFYNLQSLEHLNLEFNSINSINTGTFSSNSALKELSLNSNKLTSIPSGVFSGLSSLQLLDLNKNGIQTIASTAFQGLSNLERLDLSNNEMSNVPSQSFQHTPNLVELYLQGNPFVIIPQNSFHDLPEMTSLFLGESSALTDIETDAFAELPALSLLSIIKSPNLLNLTLQELPDAALRSVMSLHISGNGFTHLGLSTFESKESLQELYLHTNPFHCSCALKWMTRVVEDGVPWASGWKDSGTPPRCHTPEILKDYKIPHMKEVDFTCDPPYVERISPPIVYTYLKETTEIQARLFNGLPSSKWTHPDDTTYTPMRRPPGEEVKDKINTDRVSASERIDLDHSMIATLRITNASLVDGGTYTIEALNIAGVDSITFELYVYPYELTTPPFTEAVTIGSAPNLHEPFSFFIILVMFIHFVSDC